MRGQCPVNLKRQTRVHFTGQIGQWLAKHRPNFLCRNGRVHPETGV